MIRALLIASAVFAAFLFSSSVANAGIFGCPCQKAPSACSPALAPTTCQPSTPAPKACEKADNGSAVRRAAHRVRHSVAVAARLVGKVVAAPFRAVHKARCK